MIGQFIESAGGATAAACILNVSGTVIHKWKRQDPSKKAARRIALWLAYTLECEHFILRNWWAMEDDVWTPSTEEFDAWKVREFNALRVAVGLERAGALWKEINK